MNFNQTITLKPVLERLDQVEKKMDEQTKEINEILVLVQGLVKRLERKVG